MSENKLNGLLNNKNCNIDIIMRKCQINNKFDLLEIVLNNIKDSKFKRNATISNVNFIKKSINLINDIINNTLIINKDKIEFLIDSCCLSLGRSINIIKDLETIDFLSNQIINLEKTKKLLQSVKYDKEVNEVINMTFNFIKECNSFDTFKYLFDKNNYLYRVKEFLNIDFFNSLFNEYLKEIENKDINRISYYKLVIRFFTNSKFKNKNLESIYDEIDKELINADPYKQEKLNDLKKYIRRSDVIYLKPYLSVHREVYTPSIMTPKDVVDLTKYKCITIDKKGTKSCDDALILKTNDDGTFDLIMCITDISLYIKPNSKLDKLAYNLGENVLTTANGVITMYSSNIMNNLLSLDLNKEQFCLAYSFHLDSAYNIIGFEAYNAKIKVHKSFNFNEIITIYNNDSNKLITRLVEIAEKVRKENAQVEQYHLIKGSKNNDLHPNGEGFMIIEQLKILLNSTVASYYYHKGLPYIFYNQEFLEQKETIDRLKLKFNGLKSLDIIKTLNLEYGFSNYSSENKGHQGLGKIAYAHMSVPLRKYSATFDQRLDKLFLINKNFTDKDVYENEEKVKKIANHLNERLYEHKLMK